VKGEDLLGTDPLNQGAGPALGRREADKRYGVTVLITDGLDQEIQLT